MALDFTLLTAEQIWGNRKGTGQLDVIRMYGTKVAPTDLSILLGRQVGESPQFKTSEGEPSCCIWTRTHTRAGHMVAGVGMNGNDGDAFIMERYPAIRPVLPPSETAELTPTESKIGVNGVRIVEYGEYPQMLADGGISFDLEQAYSRSFIGRFIDLFHKNPLQPTGKVYTFDGANANIGTTEKFSPKSYPEYEYKGKKYIRIQPTPSVFINRLSDGKQIQGNRPYWIEVQPIEWLADPTGTWVAKKALISGIQFDTETKYDGDFSKTCMKHYLDTYFAKEIGHEEIVLKREQEKQEQQIEAEKRDKILTGLSARLEEATSDNAVEAIKKRLMEAEKDRKVKTAPNRLHEAARIKRLRNARDILNEAAQKAYEAKDEALLDGIIELSSTYAARYQGQQNRVARRRAARKQGGRG